ncbi:type II toxin-antitoxin system RelE/ParE family toxin [Candidatus Micrarchaeota archaeon]|nr:type II toxin-antitoxin system RelE/ParE family toxin [Candidatus Micrarchaeota archaeon]
MSWKILISEKARKEFYSLDEIMQKRIKNSFHELKKNPFQKRSRADIKKIKGSFNPEFYRLRVGNYRLVYVVTEKEVKITSIVHREKGYNWLE